MAEISANLCRKQFSLLLKISRNIALAVLLLALGFGKASGQQKSFINGLAADEYIGRPAYLIRYADPISQLTEIVDESVVAADGSFHFEVPVEAVQLYKINIHSINASLLLEPGSSYSIFFPYLEKDQSWNLSNRLEVALVFTNPDSTGINFLTTQYNRSYYNFYSENAAILSDRRLMAKKIRQFTDSLSQIYQAVEDPYFQIFLKCSNAELKLTNGFTRKVIYDSLLQKLPLLPQNVGWSGLMETFYGEYFQTFDLRFGGEVFANRFNKTTTFQQVDSLLLTDDFLQHRPLSHYVLLMAIAENIKNSQFSQQRMIETLQYLKNTNEPIVSQIAENLLKKYERNALNTPAPDIAIVDTLGRVRSLSENFGSEPTLLIFSAPWCVSCTNELKVLQSFEAEYGPYFKPVVLVLESDTGAFRHYAAKSMFPTFRVKNLYRAKELYGITSLPAFVLIDGEGRLTNRYAPWPSSGFQALLHKWKTAATEKERLKIGQ